MQLGLNSLAVPVTLYAAARAGAAFTPLNYRLADPDLVRIATRAAPAPAVVDHDMVRRVASVDGLSIIETEHLGSIEAQDFVPDFDTDNVAIMLFTSGTTGEPKAAVLRHRHVTSYVMGTLEFASADEDEATLVTVPAYHIAGISSIVSSTYVGRRIVYLAAFDPATWVSTAASEAITHAMVVPTMLGRILDVMDAEHVSLPALRHLSYGGGKMPVPVIERALALMPHVDFVNAYGLTETSSTIAVLTPDDHREALASDDPDVRRRLGSVGRPSPSVEISIRDPFGEPVPDGEAGRDLGTRRAGVGRVHRARRWQRLVRHPRRWVPRRGWVPVHRGAPRRRHRAWRREHLARARSRRCCGRTPRLTTSRCTRSRRRSGARTSARRSCLIDAVDADELARMGACPPALDARPHPDRHPHRAAVQRDRQAAPPRAQGRGGVVGQRVNRR